MRAGKSSGADGSLRPLVLTWSTHQIGGLGSARGSSAGRPLLLVLKLPSSENSS